MILYGMCTKWGSFFADHDTSHLADICRGDLQAMTLKMQNLDHSNEIKLWVLPAIPQIVKKWGSLSGRAFYICIY